MAIRFTLVLKMSLTKGNLNKMSRFSAKQAFIYSSTFMIDPSYTDGLDKYVGELAQAFEKVSNAIIGQIQVNRGSITVVYRKQIFRKWREKAGRLLLT